MNKKLIHYVIGIILMLIGHLFPDGAVITALGYQIMFIFLGALYLWCTTDMFWPSLLSLVMLGTTSYGTAPGVIGSAMSNTTVMQMFYMMLVAGIAKESGLISFMARKIVQSRFAKKYPWGLTCSIMVAAFLGAGLVSGIPSLLICWALVYQIAEQVGCEKYDKWPTMTLIGIGYAACFGVSLMPYQFTVVGFFGITKGIFPGLSYNYLSWIGIAILIFAVSTGLYLFCCKIFFKPDVSYLKKGYDVDDAIKLDGRQRKALGIMACMILVMMLPSVLPKGTTLYTFFNNKIGVIGTAILAICAALMLKHNGKPFITFTELSKNIIWSVLMLSAAAITLSAAMVSEETGIQAFLLQTLDPILSKTSSGMFVFAFCLFTLLLTNLINNAIVKNIFVPLMCTLSVAFDVNVMVVTGLMIFSCTMAFFLPSSSPYGAMLHGNKDWLKTTDVFKHAAIMMVTTMIALMVAYPVAGAIL